MKKLSLIVVSLLLTTFAYSQPTFHKILATTKYTYDGTKWNVIETKQVDKDIFVIINNTEVTVGTYKYKTYGEYEKTTTDDHIAFVWKCVNSDGQNCYFMMKMFKPEVSTHGQYSFIYPDQQTMFEYECED